MREGAKGTEGGMIVSLLFLTLSVMVEGTEASDCIFPFIYEGQWFSSCIPNGRADRQYWCATTSNYDQDKKWVICPAADLPDNSLVALCIFPFIFNRKRHFSCTTEGRSDGQYWCATTSNYDLDKQWVLCSGSDLGLRLMNGGDPCAGRVELHYPEGGWGTICYDGWDFTAATRVCKQIACGHAVAVSNNSSFGESTGPIAANHVRCADSRQQLQKCPISSAEREHFVSCDRSMESGVFCSDYGKLRLASGPNSCSGRLEIFFSSHWGTVCDSNWSMPMAEVVCRQLGCGRALLAVGAASFGEGKGPVWLDSVECNGTESFLWQCSSKAINKHSCTHKHDVGVTCSGAAQLDAQEDTPLISPLVPVICGLLGVLCIVAVGWFIKSKRENQRTGLHVALSEVRSKTKEPEGGPESIYENIDDLRETKGDS